VIALALALRVFSADYCADQYVLALAPRAEIAALSPDARKDFSFLRARAVGIRQARPDAEAALASGADLVLRFWGGDARAFERAGLAVVTLPYADDFGGVAETIAAAASALGREREGAALAGEMRAKLGALSARGPSGQTGVYLTPGGVTAGKGTLVDAMFRAAGVRNRAADEGLSYWPALPAELIVQRPPTFYVGGFFNADSETRDNWSAARHPAIMRALSSAHGVMLTPDLLSCPAWFAADAAQRIRDAADAAARGAR